MFVFLEADGFASQAKKMSEARGKGPDKDKTSSVRRPYRGVEIKEDTYATLSVIRADNVAIKLTSSSAEVNKLDDSSARKGEVTEYSDFILQNIQDQRAEKQQIVETFGEPFIYFFGERPRVVTFSGMLVNTADFNWRSQFWYNYDKFLRGTKLVQNNARVYLSYDTILIEGYPFQASAQDVSDAPYSIPFSMQMFVTAYYDFSRIGQTRYPGALSLPKNIATMNRELKAERGKFVSTTSAVRKMNFEQQGPKGFLSALRSGIRGFNNLMNTAGNFLQKASQVMGGRVVRVPQGVAGYLTSVGEASFGVGATSFGEGGAEPWWDLKTGEAKNVTGSVKIRAPRAAGFAPTWVSSVDESFRGFIWENVDEYAQRKVPQTIQDLLRPDELIEYEMLNDIRKLKKKTYEADLEKRVLELVGKGTLLQDLAEGVAFAKSAYGTYANAKEFINDPEGSVKALVGLQSQEGSIADIMKSKGVMLNPIDAAKHIGESAAKSFKQVAEDVTEVTQLAFGSSFEQAGYKTALALAGVPGVDNAYESLFGKSDYTDLVGDASVLDLATTGGVVSGFQDVDIRGDVEDVLHESYGDNDDAPDGSEIDPIVFDVVYPNTVTLVDADGMSKATVASTDQSGGSSGIADDVSGIRGVDSDSAPMPPIR